MKKLACVVALVLVSASAAGAQTMVTSRAALGATGFFDWSVLGAANTLVNNPTAGIVGTTTGGITATVSKQSVGPLQRRDEGIGWGGNFANGDALLWTNDTPGFMRIEFSSAVSAVGAQFQANVFDPFTGILRVFNGATLLNSFALAGNSTFDRDNSAIFLGAENASITAIEYEVSGATIDFAINRLSVRAATVVPEPSTYALLASGLFAIGFAARRRRSA